ncbi:MAG: YXWGXW repeat-containing protein [Verrucomicrobia bacterium]|nr:YXWGXW repeat-containing protein [Verrucomicrobiota bacterium]
MLATLAASFFALTITPGRAQVFVRVAPPAPIVEPGPPRPPGPGYVWVAGHWHWNGYRWVWRHGHYVLRPRGRGEWVPAHYDRRPGGWVYVPGHWR